MGWQTAKAPQREIHPPILRILFRALFTSFTLLLIIIIIIIDGLLV